MPSLKDKIDADAAQRLPLPAGRHPSSELPRYRNFLKVEKHRLKLLHRSGTGGKEICRGQAAVLDALLGHLLESMLHFPPADQIPRSALALVATGGYGRGELNPFSDIDILFLHSGDLVVMGKPKPPMSALVDGLLYTLWDIGLKVGHAVREVEDCVKIANSDMQSKTALIEARLVAGNQSLFERMQSSLLAKCVRGHEQEYVGERIADQETRRTKHGNSPFMQEPNIKNGCGGLRDYQNLIWMAYVKYRVRSLGELKERELISATEQRQLDAAYTFLLWTRNELHYQANRPVDVVAKAFQPSIALRLGYTDRSPRRRLQQFMKELYLHMRAIFLITRTVEQRLALFPQIDRLATIRSIFRRGRRGESEVVDGFKLVGSEIVAASNRVFVDQPRRLMRVFLRVQQSRATLHPDLAQAVRNHVHLVDRSFLEDSGVRETFLEILNQRGNVAPVLRLMHELDFLGKYLPEFGKLTCLVQHEFYHQYAADEHTLVCLEKLDGVWEAKQPPFSDYSELFLRVERPFVVYLALLLHDAGKALEDGPHSDSGSRLAVRVAKRLGLDAAITHVLRLLIENHLVMSQISQRRDLDDPSVIESFAKLIETEQNLDLLTLHTFSDSQGTNPQLWNGFKNSLLLTLHRETMRVFHRGSDFLLAEEKQRESLAAEVRKLSPKTFGDDEIHEHFDRLPQRYFRIHPARDIARDVSLAHRFMQLQVREEDQGEKALTPIVAWHDQADRGYTAVHICTWDRVGLFANIAGCFTAAGLNILSAQIFTRTDGIILDTFFVTDAKTGGLAQRGEMELFEHHLHGTLAGRVEAEALLKKRMPLGRHSEAAGQERIETTVHFDNDTSDSCTVLELAAEDRVGLLYLVAQTLAELGLDIALAKISTENGAALDSFYLSQEKRKITSKEFQRFVADRVRAAISKLDG